MVNCIHGSGLAGQSKHHKGRKGQTCRGNPLHLDPRHRNSIVRAVSIPSPAAEYRPNKKAAACSPSAVGTEK